MVKCDSLGQIWGNSVPGLHTWFQRKRASFFIESAIISTRGNAGIESPFYTNGLQLKRRLQKNKLVESNIEKKVDPKNNLLQKWMEEFKREEIRAVQDLGKYHLAQEHQTFAIDPATCDK